MDLDSTFSSLRSACQDYGDLIVNPHYFKSDEELSWPGADRLIKRFVYRMSDLREMERTRQYSFQTTDGSIFCVYYQYAPRGRTLKKASLAFYSARTGLGLDGAVDELKALDESPSGQLQGEPPVPQEAERQGSASLEAQFAFADEEGFDFGASSPLDVDSSQEDELAVVPWLRIDFDPTAKRRGVLHHDCHLHIAGFFDGRVPVTAVPSPRQFVDLIVAFAYPERFRAARLQSDHELSRSAIENGQRTVCHHAGSAEWLALVPHLMIPGGERLSATPLVPDPHRG